MTNVSPTAVRPSHNVSLSDGTTTLGLRLCDNNGKLSPQLQIMPLQRTALKISQGGSRYDDMVSPYSSTIQNTFEGGRANKMFESDKSRFYDSNKLDTMSGKAFLAGKPTYTTGYYSSAVIGTRNGDYSLSATATAKVVVSKYTPGADTVIRMARFYLKNITGISYPFTLTAKIYSDTAGAPDTLLASSDAKSFTKLKSAYEQFDFDIPATTLTHDTDYWVGIEIEAGKKCYLGRDTSETGNAIQVNDGSGWSSTANQCIAVVLTTTASGEGKFFQYKGAMYVVTKPDDFSVPTLWLNGYRGVATSNSADKTKINTKLNLSGVDLVGKVVRITAGPGSKEETPFRTIISNTTTGTDDSITVDKIWKVAHTTSTEFVVLGCDTWQEITGHGLTKPVTDVVVVDDMVWFAQGSEAVMRRFRQYNNSGTWTSQFDAETAYAEYLVFQNDQKGKRYIWISIEGTNQVKRAAVPSSWADISPGSAIECGSSDETITGLEIYGEPPMLYVFKEGSFGSVNENLYAETPIYEMKSVRDWVNGRAHFRFDVYLYFSLLDGLERFYNNHLDDVGPNKDEGLPEGRQGFIRDIVAYPGRYYAAIDAGDGSENYSSILCCPAGGGWHEVYRAPAGKRIRRLFIQPIPELIDRLWISEEEDLVWIPVTLNPLKDPLYEYDSGGSVITSWIYHDMLDINKWFNKVTIFSEGLKSTTVGETTTLNQYITLEYQLDDYDDADDWVSVGSFSVSPVDSLDLSATKNITGRRIRFKFTMYTDDTSITPVFEAWRLDSVVRIKQGRGYKLNFILDDYPSDLQGMKESDTVDSTLTKLETWADSETQAAPLLLHSLYNSFDDRYVFIDNPIVTMKAVNTDPVRTEQAICSLVVQEAV